jgi:hypothetical protein
MHARQLFCQALPVTPLSCARPVGPTVRAPIRDRPGLTSPPAAHRLRVAPGANPVDAPR